MPEGHGGGTGGRRQPQPRRALLTVVGIVVLLIAAIAFANRGDGSGSPDSGGSAAGGSGGSGGGKDATSSTATAPTGERPVTGKAAGIPSGFAHTEQGAQSAAANYAVALGGVDMFNADRRHAIVNQVYGPAAASVQGPLDRAYSGEALKALGLKEDGTAPTGLTFVSRTVPVGTKVTANAANAMTVEVWCTDLVGLAGQGSTNPVSSAWFTITEKLAWSAGDWKIQSSTQKDGPAPVNGDTRAATADEIAGAVRQYGGFTYAR
jgi:hypothetical protein